MPLASHLICKRLLNARMTTRVTLRQGTETRERGSSLMINTQAEKAMDVGNLEAGSTQSCTRSLSESAILLQQTVCKHFLSPATKDDSDRLLGAMTIHKAPVLYQPQ